ncbi:MAG: DMT family transporter [Flavobacteriales bacterium]|nr:DMT family transporter [Flavobacteriales bacterium]MCB9447888.1 DMT family transporter [Flavobacteriales bacterium]
MLYSTLAFSMMHICVKSLTHIPAHEIILFRSAVTLIISFAFLRYHRLPVFGTNRKILVLRGTVGVIALTLFFITLQRIPLAAAVTLQHLSPIFTVLFSMLFLSEKVKPSQWLFFLVAFSGVLLIKGFDERIEPIFMLLGILSAVFSGLAYVCIRILRHTDHAYNVVFYFPLVATPVMGIWCMINWVQPMGYEWGLLILAGVFTQVGQIFMTRSLQAEEASSVAILKYLSLVYALGFGYFLFDETYPWMSLAGIGLIFAGVGLNTFRRKVSL